MFFLLKRIYKTTADFLGYAIERERPTALAVSAQEFPLDFTAQEREIWRSVEQHTMTSKERVVSLIRAVQYLERNRVPGAFVECGVWRGGSMMAAAKTLLMMEKPDRELFLFDTYCGMPDPALVDVDVHGRSAEALLADSRKLPVQKQDQNHIIAHCPLEIVRTNLVSTGYPPEKLHFVEGRVEETIPKHAASHIALLRLDTDWYESTRHELIHLFPRLSSRGILIIDDYGHWQGSRIAVDEYFEQNPEPIFLSRIDHTARIGVRC